VYILVQYGMVTYPIVPFLFFSSAVLCCALVWSGMVWSDDIASLMVTCMLSVTPEQIFQRLHQLLHRRLLPYQ
jgi:hypothetical protein